MQIETIFTVLIIIGLILLYLYDNHPDGFN